ncbi:MAG: VCBS repeat-containing protein, partial [Planctomycetota bacterium]
MKTQLALVLPVFLILTAALLFLTGACGSDSTPPAKPVAKATPTAGMPFAYVDVAGPMGYTMRNRTGRDRAKDLIVEAMPPGIAVGDFNGDGWMDMFGPNGNLVKGVNVNQQTPILLSDDEAPRNALYMNREGKRFEDVAKEAGVDGTRWSFGAVAGDIDNDGDTDIFLCNWGKNRLYLNDGTGKFTDVALEAGAAGASRDWSAGAALFDYDGDGDLDIYVAQYADMHAAMADPELVRINPKTGEMNGRTCDWRGLKVYCGPLGLMPQNDVLLESQLAQTGELTFKDVTKKAGLFIEINAESNKEGSRGPYYGFQPIVWDIDGNGHPDVFVANDSVRNVCWMNNGDGTFEDHAEEMGLAVSLDDFVPQASMGVNIADINGDGLQDVVISEFSHDQFNMLVGHRLKDGRVVFDEKSAQTRIREFTFAALGWGVGLLDPDHDGDIDVFFACGHVYPEVNTRPNTGTTYDQLNLMILNLRQDPLKFENVTAKAGPGIASMRRPS